MIDVKFDDYSYYPALRTRQAELKGLEYLDEARPAKIVPLLTLGRWPKALSFTKAADKAKEVMNGRPYFIDLTTDRNHLPTEQTSLRSPDNAFAAWRSFATSSESAIPVAQLGGHGVRV